MIDRIELKASFQDTQRRIKEDPVLAERTAAAQAGTLLYLADYRAINPRIKTDSPDIQVADDTTFHCAQAYAAEGCRTAVLNFANAYSPGGGVANGAMAQEECLCRSSNLYNTLTIPYLLKNYYKWNARNTGDMGTDAVIWSPGITVFKTDDPLPREMEPWFQADVLTSAAPYINPDKKKPVPEEKLRAVLTGRIRNILEVAAAQDADVLVLGAFGCGVFNNPPALVADIFREFLVSRAYGRYFRKILFAIPDRPGNPNFRVFEEAFSSGDRCL